MYKPEMVLSNGETGSSLMVQIWTYQFEDARLRVIQDGVLSGRDRKDDLNPEVILRIEVASLILKLET